MPIEVVSSGFSKEDGYDDKSVPEQILEAKQERDTEDQLFEDVCKAVDKWYGTQVSVEAKNLIPLSSIIMLKNEINKNKKIKRYNSFGKGNPECYWDFFEMFDFICYLRTAQPESMNAYLKNYKGGKYNR